MIEKNNSNNINKKVVIIIFLVLFIAIFVLFGLSKNHINTNSNIKSKKLVNIINQAINSSSGNIEETKKIFGNDIVDYNNKLNSGDFEESTKIADKIISAIYNKSDSDKIFDSKDKSLSNKENKQIILASAKYLKAASILNYGNYYYKEKESADKAEQILNEVQTIDESLVNNPYGMYYLGYSKEIKKEYSKALEYYNDGIKYAGKDGYILSVLYNQIGHVYDLSGDMMKAYENYVKAYGFNPNNIQVSLNIGRCLMRLNKYKESIVYFKYGLNSINKPLKSEVYTSLAAIELDGYGLSPNIDKSIEYANKSIENFSGYPLAYVILSRAYYLKNNKSDYKLIESNLTKAIKLNSNGFAAYKYYALHFFDIDNIDSFKQMAGMAMLKTDTDPILMDNTRKNEKQIVEGISLFLLHLNGFNPTSDNDLNDYLIGLDKIIGNKYYMSDFILQQIIRGNNGIFEKFKNKSLFKDFIKKYTK